MVMEYVEGEDLRKRLQARGKLPPAQALPIIRQILAARRRLRKPRASFTTTSSPRTSCLTAAGTVKVADFGLGGSRRTSCSRSSSPAAWPAARASRSGDLRGTCRPSSSGASRRTRRRSLRCRRHRLRAARMARRPTGVGIARMFEREKIDPALADLFEKALDDRDHAYRSAADMLAATNELAAGMSGYDIVLHEVDEEKRRLVQTERFARAERRQAAEEERRRQKEAAEARSRELDLVLREREKRRRRVGPPVGRAGSPGSQSPRPSRRPHRPSPAKPRKKRGCCGCLVMVVIAAAILARLDHRGEIVRAIQQQWEALRLPHERQVDLGGGVRLAMLLVPRGQFQMGDSLAPEEVVRRWPGGQIDWYRNAHPSHLVRFAQPFDVGKTEVTRGQFDQFVRTTGYQTVGERAGKVWTISGGGWVWLAGPSWRNPGFPRPTSIPSSASPGTTRSPSAPGSRGKTGGPMPCRPRPSGNTPAAAGSTTTWPWGESEEGAQGKANVAGEGEEISWFAKFKGVRDGYTYTAPVASFATNSFGLYDMIGNVREWCLDGYSTGYAEGTPVSTLSRALRGGCWNDSPAQVRSAFPRLCRSLDRRFPQRLPHRAGGEIISSNGRCRSARRFRPEGTAGFSRRLQPPDRDVPFFFLGAPKGRQNRFCRPFGTSKEEKNHRGRPPFRRLKPPAKSCRAFGTKMRLCGGLPASKTTSAPRRCPRCTG